MNFPRSSVPPFPPDLRFCRSRSRPDFVGPRAKKTARDGYPIISDRSHPALEELIESKEVVYLVGCARARESVNMCAGAERRPLDDEGAGEHTPNSSRRAMAARSRNFTVGLTPLNPKTSTYSTPPKYRGSTVALTLSPLVTCLVCGIIL